MGIAGKGRAQPQRAAGRAGTAGRRVGKARVDFFFSKPYPTRAHLGYTGTEHGYSVFFIVFIKSE
jgi:hypothetical protein